MVNFKYSRRFIGDTQKGFAEADLTIEDTCGYEIFPNPLPPEPPGFIASWKTPDCLTVYTPSQSIAKVRLVCMPFIGMADMQTFKYATATSVADTIAILSECGEKAKWMAGGTDLLCILKTRATVAYPEVIVNIKSITGLDEIKADDQGLTLGAFTCLAVKGDNRCHALYGS